MVSFPHARFLTCQVQPIVQQLVDAIHYLHDIGICHRNVKPENVMCTHSMPHVHGHVKLGDFGFAAKFSNAASDLPCFTRLVGTPEYLAPEIVRAYALAMAGKMCTPYCSRVDLWSLGCLIYELLSGSPPFIDTGHDELFCLILRGPIKMPPEVCAAAPPQPMDHPSLIDWIGSMGAYFSSYYGNVDHRVAHCGLCRSAKAHKRYCKGFFNEIRNRGCQSVRLAPAPFYATTRGRGCRQSLPHADPSAWRAQHGRGVRSRTTPT